MDMKSLRQTMVTAAAVTIIAAGLGVALAQTNTRVPPDQKVTAQKAEFVENLVTKSVSVTTIENSGDGAAIARLVDARELVAEAKGDLAGGRYVVADEKLDAALHLVNDEARRLSKAEVSGERSQLLYDRRLHAVETFLSAYERVSADGGATAANKAQMGEIKRLVGQAKGLAAAGKYDDGRAVLDDAYQIARGDIKSMRQGKTLTRSLDFKSAAEEYEYERGRNESHFMLLKFALSEKEPPASMKGRIEEYRKAAENLRTTASSEAAAGKHDVAIQHLNDSTNTLLKAIRMGGIFVPG